MWGQENKVLFRSDNVLRSYWAEQRQITLSQPDIQPVEVQSSARFRGLDSSSEVKKGLFILLY